MKLMLSTGFKSNLINYYYSKSSQWVSSQKYDGICVKTTEDGPRTRNGKEIQNPYLREALSQLPAGLQGEIAANDIAAEDAFKTAVSLTMTKHIDEAKHIELFSQCSFVIFNYESEGVYLDRLQNATELTKEFDWVRTVELTPVRLEDAEALAQDVPGEGLIIAAADAPYFNGRCNKTNPWSLKIKKMDDEDAIIVSVEVEKYGENLKSVPAELWGTYKNQISKLRLWNERFGHHSAGTGLTKAQKVDIFNNPDKYIGQTCTIEFMSCGVDQKPRQPRIKTLIRRDK